MTLAYPNFRFPVATTPKCVFPASATAMSHSNRISLVWAWTLGSAQTWRATLKTSGRRLHLTWWCLLKPLTTSAMSRLSTSFNMRTSNEHATSYLTLTHSKTQSITSTSQTVNSWRTKSVRRSSSSSSTTQITRRQSCSLTGSHHLRQRTGQKTSSSTWRSNRHIHQTTNTSSGLGFSAW